MKKSNIIKLFTFALLAVLVASCSKYEEGSKFTVLTKKSRMANTWTMTSYTIGGSEQISTTTTSTWELTKDGAVTASYTNGAGTVNYTGTWAFNDDKSSVVITDVLGATGTYEIVQLKSKDLKLRQTNSIGGINLDEIWTFTGV
ncbi:MAG: hypothetical protein HRT57_06520 [Crocinitomicaceae bacterium]|nr:hypothetical protein [Crocinitomicaceae bacterium]